MLGFCRITLSDNLLWDGMVIICSAFGVFMRNVPSFSDLESCVLCPAFALSAILYWN